MREGLTSAVTDTLAVGVCAVEDIDAVGGPTHFPHVTATVATRAGVEEEPVPATGSQRTPVTCLCVDER